MDRRQLETGAAGSRFAGEETSKYTDLMADGSAREFTFYMEAKSIITRPSGGQRLNGAEADAASNPFKQDGPERLLHLADRMADRARRKVQLRGRSVEGFPTGRRFEDPQSRDRHFQSHWIGLR